MTVPLDDPDMVDAPTLVLKGLLEGLVLLAIEREPTHGYGILKDLEELLGEGPTKSQVYSLLQRLEDDDLIVSEEREEEGRSRVVYRLTAGGQERLDEFRDLPVAFKHRVVDLFDIPPPDDMVAKLEAQGHVEELAAMEGAPLPQPPRRAGPGEPAPDAEPGWVDVRIEELPRGPEVQAPYARFSFDREPGTGTWSLTVEQHRPGSYEGADACPLSYLYQATQRLLFDQGR